jgi:hypothetical protein
MGLLFTWVVETLFSVRQRLLGEAREKEERDDKALREELEVIERVRKAREAGHDPRL